VNYYCISHHCVRNDVWCIITASVITVCVVICGALLLHQSSLCAEWRLVHYYCINHHCVRIDLWCTTTASVITVCGVTSDALFLHQSSLCVEWCVVHYYSIFHHCVQNNDWCFISASLITVRNDVLYAIISWVITVCGTISCALLLHHSSLCAEYVELYYCISHHCELNICCTITASVFTACRMMSDALVLHQSSLRDEWCLMHYYCISHQFAHTNQIWIFSIFVLFK